MTGFVQHPPKMGPWRRESTRRAGPRPGPVVLPSAFGERTLSRLPGPVGTTGACSASPNAFGQLIWPSRFLESVPVPGESDQSPAIPPPGRGWRVLPTEWREPTGPPPPPALFRCCASAAVFTLRNYASPLLNPMTSLKISSATRTMPVCKAVFDPTTSSYNSRKTF